MPEADSETTLARRGSGMVRLPDLRGGQERDGWGSSWRQPASPQRVSLGSGGVTLLASTSATPELRPAFEPCRLLDAKQTHFPGRSRTGLRLLGILGWHGVENLFDGRRHPRTCRSRGGPVLWIMSAG